MSAGFTKGPWVAEVYSDLAEARADYAFLWAVGGKTGLLHRQRPACVWLQTPTGGHTGLPGRIETTEANAHLIAAAPDMYEALEVATKLLRTIEGLHDAITVTGDIEYCERALAKARGEA